MNMEEYILVNDFCSHYHIEITFIRELADHGLIEIIQEEEHSYLPIEGVGKIEKLIRLHQDLEIHPADLDVVYDLMERIDSLEKEIELAHRKIAQFENRFLSPGGKDEDW